MILGRDDRYNQPVQFAKFQVKLDRALVLAAFNIPSCLKLVSHLCEYGQTHGIEIVAEGIENVQMFEKLKPVGCHISKATACIGL